MNWLDIVVLLLLLLNIAFGWFSGFIKAIINFVSIVASLIITKIYYLTFAEYIDNKFNLMTKIEDIVFSNISKIKFPDMETINNASSNDLENIFDNSEILKSIAEKFIGSDTFKELLSRNVTDFARSFTEWVSNIILIILSIAAVFILSFIIIRILGFILSKIFDLPILNGINKTVGLFYGILKGTLMVMVFILILIAVDPLIGSINIISQIEVSKFAIYFYKYNIIIYIFELIT